MAIGKVTNRTARKNLRRKSMTSQEFDVGSAALPASFVCAFPAGSKVVIDSVSITMSESWDTGSTTIIIGHATASGALNNNTLTASHFFTTADTVRTKREVTLAAEVMTHKAWPGKPVIPGGSSIWVQSPTWTTGGATTGMFHVTVHYWEFDDEYD